MKRLNILLFSLLIFIFQCKQKTASENVLIEKNETSIKSNLLEEDTLSYNKFEKFIQVNDSIYKASNIEIVDMEGVLYLHLDSGTYDQIDFDGIDYDGPGYSFSLLTSLKVQSNKLIVIEAQSDIGTAWYYFIFVENDKVTDSFLIQEPRSNSESYSIEQFIKVCKTNNKYVLMFKKELIAPYSRIPSQLLQKDWYFILEKNISELEGMGTTVVNTNNNNRPYKLYSNEGIQNDFVWKGIYNFDQTILRYMEEFNCKYSIKILNQEFANISSQINDRNIKQHTAKIISFDDDSLVLNYSDNNANDEIILYKVEDGYEIGGMSIYLLNPPNERYPIIKE